MKKVYAYAFIVGAAAGYASTAHVTVLFLSTMMLGLIGWAAVCKADKQ